MTERVYRRPLWGARTIGARMAARLNPAVSRLAVRGRTTGRWHTVSVAVLEHDGQRYLLAAAGDTDWSLSLRASGRERGACRPARAAHRGIPAPLRQDAHLRTHVPKTSGPRASPDVPHHLCETTAMNALAPQLAGENIEDGGTDVPGVRWRRLGHPAPAPGPFGDCSRDRSAWGVEPGAGRCGSRRPDLGDYQTDVIPPIASLGWAIEEMGTRLSEAAQ
jgi:hypothetical protein